MLEPGDHVSEGFVWTAPNVRSKLSEVLVDGRVLLFYLFDWSAT